MIHSVIYWFRNDLRLHDNPSLQRAIDTGLPVIPVFIVDDAFMAQHPLGFERLGDYRQKFLYQSIADLSKNIENAGNKLWVFRGDSVSILNLLYNQLNAKAVFVQAEYAFEEQQMEQALASTLNLQLLDGSMLFPPKMVPFGTEKSPFYYTSFKNKVWDLGHLVKPVPIVTNIPFDSSYNPANFVEIFKVPDVPDCGVFNGGEYEGLRRMDSYFTSQAPLQYIETRNQLHGQDFSTWLSPWLANGSLSVQLVWQKLNALNAADEVGKTSIQTIKEQLIWRDYFRFLMMRYGEKLFWLKGLRSSAPTMYNDVETYNKWRLGKTGQPIVDALMNELRQTGFMSNRGRMLVSYYLAKELKVNWQWGAAWFESMLIDYDVYSNSGNWAYQSGRGTDSRVNRRFNLIKQAEKFDADGSFRRKWGSGA
jgi:deoxyribodipyrimidine photo-lyase